MAYFAKLGTGNIVETVISINNSVITDNNGTGGNGGSGVVILRLPTSRYSGTTTGSPTVTTSGSNTILTFNASGSYTA